MSEIKPSLPKAELLKVDDLIREFERLNFTHVNDTAPYPEKKMSFEYCGRVVSVCVAYKQLAEVLAAKNAKIELLRVALEDILDMLHNRTEPRSDIDRLDYIDGKCEVTLRDYEALNGGKAGEE